MTLTLELGKLVSGEKIIPVVENCMKETAFKHKFRYKRRSGRYIGCSNWSAGLVSYSYEFEGKVEFYKTEKSRSQILELHRRNLGFSLETALISTLIHTILAGLSIPALAIPKLITHKIAEINPASSAAFRMLDYDNMFVEIKPEQYYEQLDFHINSLDTAAMTQDKKHTFGPAVKSRDDAYFKKMRPAFEDLCSFIREDLECAPLIVHSGGAYRGLNKEVLPIHPIQ